MKDKLKRNALRTGTALDQLVKMHDAMTNSQDPPRRRDLEKMKEPLYDAVAANAVTRQTIEQLIENGLISDLEVNQDGSIDDRPDDTKPKSAMRADAAKFAKLIRGGARPISGPGGLFRDPSWDRRR